MENFKLLKIEDSLKNSLQKMNFTKPTPIQAMAIPVALEGKDILGTAQTGTGKTLAFSIPLINKLILDKNAFALVMCPTRELATQVMEAIKSIISDKINIKSALLIGGESMQKQLRQLGNRSRIIVGTPGRINDHLKRKSLNLSATKYLVLDETDRMLDMGFTPQIEMILKFVPKDHQTLLFSATLPQNILRISDRYLNKPERISTGATSVPIAKIKQETLQVFKENKYDELIDQFLARKGSILVFVKTKRGADKMVKKLKEEGHSADAIHGDLRQSKRDRVINSFRKGLKRILIATDVAARGLDIPLIQHVINLELITPSVSDFQVDERRLRIDVEVDKKESSPRYCGISIVDVEVKDSPEWIQNRLKSIGLTPKNNIVDITNYVLHELGQPLHAFDAEKLDGNKVVDKTLKSGTKFTTLDGIEREVHSEDIMICDAALNPLCIAGVFGGINSGVTKKTTSIFLESAYFNPVSIRKTAKRHALNTDASFRFERGIDINFTKYALKRAAILIKEYSNGKIASDIMDFYPEKMEDFQVFFSYENAFRLIGQELDKETIKNILASLEIKISSETEAGLGLTIPSFRVDVQREADIIEEFLEFMDTIISNFHIN